MTKRQRVQTTKQPPQEDPAREQPPPEKPSRKRSVVKWGCSCGCALVLLLVVGCLVDFGRRARNFTNPEDVPATVLYPVRQRPQSEVAIVFVHGFTGSSATTWKSEKANVKRNWPEIVMDDPRCDIFDVYTFQYPTNYMSQWQRIDSIAESLKTCISTSSVKSKKIIFVCHSMGGLIVRKCIFTHDKIFKQTEGIYYAGTPAKGSDFANYFRYFSGNPQIDDLAEDDGGLKTLMQTDWINSGKFNAIPSFGSFENAETIIVPEESVQPLVNRSLQGMPYNHWQLVKPEDEADLRHTHLVESLAEITPAYALTATKEMPTDTFDAWIEKQKTVKNLNPRSKTEGTPGEGQIQIRNASGLECILLIYDCTIRPEQKPLSRIDLTPRFEKIPANSHINGKWFLESGNACGWFLFFRRYVDESGKVANENLGAFDIFKTTQLLLSQDGDRPDGYVLQEFEPEPEAE